MLKVEMIKFEIEDIITTSGDGVASGGNGLVMDACTDGGHNMSLNKVDGTWQVSCSKCGYTGSTSGGDITTN